MGDGGMGGGMGMGGMGGSFLGGMGEGLSLDMPPLEQCLRGVARAVRAAGRGAKVSAVAPAETRVAALVVLAG